LGFANPFHAASLVPLYLLVESPPSSWLQRPPQLDGAAHLQFPGKQASHDDFTRIWVVRPKGELRIEKPLPLLDVESGSLIL
jgi:hypothetical protein